MSELRYVGNYLPNDQASGKVTGSTVYTSDLCGPGMLYLKCRPSETAHGWIQDIDTEEASRLPGVRKIYTWENTPDRYYDRGRVSFTENVPNQEKLFDRHIRYYGERVAAVVAESPEAAEAACALIRVRYEELPRVLNTADGLRADAPLLHEEGNVYEAPAVIRGSFEKAAADRQFRTEVSCGRITHLSMETSGARARYDKSTGKLTVWSGTQTVFGARSTIAELLSMPCSKVRVIKMPMGGSFGCKQEMIAEPLTAYAAKDLEADVKWILTREEQFVNTMQKHALEARIGSKFSRDGRLEGLSLDLTLDAGAYQTVSGTYLRAVGAKLGKTYQIKNILYRGRSVCTNTPVCGSFRSWGSTELALCLESHMNHAAAKLGIDPVELRLRNVLEEYAQDGILGISAGNVRFREVLLKGRERFGWEEQKKECAEKNAGNGRYRYGVGMAVCSHTSSFYIKQTDVATASMSVQEDGSILVRLSVHDHGCGTVTALKKIAAEVLEIEPGRIEIPEADTENTAYDYGCYASRSVYSLGNAVKRCAEELLERMKDLAAQKIGCMTTAVRYADGYFYKENKARGRISLRNLWAYALEQRGIDLSCSCTVNAGANPGTAAAHFVRVKVDTCLGSTEVERYLAVHDVGKAVNPELCAGQIGSGVQQGIGIALMEEIKLDPLSGRMLITGFKNYEVTNASGMPDYDYLLVEDHEPTGPFGAKGIGEVVVAPAPPAILAAVNDALGTELCRLPLTPPVILEALSGKEKDKLQK